MNILIYEIPNGYSSAKYIRYVIDRKRVNLFPVDKFTGPKRLTYGASRIWEWDTENDSVRYVKNRYSGLAEDAEVDPKEFLMIQLAAKEYKVTRQI